MKGDLPLQGTLNVAKMIDLAAEKGSLLPILCHQVF
jgi:hypothetical protein